MNDLERSQGRRGRRLALAAALLVGLAAAPGEAGVGDTTTFRATYTISIGTAVIGRATAESRFTDDSYVAAITGSTGGVSRLVSDASARLSGAGRISGEAVLPSTFTMETVERGFATHVHMAMKNDKITNLVAVPRLSEAPDRIPVTPGHKTGVVDPLGAFIVPLTGSGSVSGRAACDRTIKVFDGWTRFNIQLYYKGAKAVDGGSDTYAGRIVVCGAHYVPVAGHRANADTLNDLVDDKRLEVWLAPVKNTTLLVPFRILIGTRFGDLVVHATRFSAQPAKDRASLD